MIADRVYGFEATPTAWAAAALSERRGRETLDLAPAPRSRPPVYAKPLPRL
jgi:hypothetical protein